MANELTGRSKPNFEKYFLSLFAAVINYCSDHFLVYIFTVSLYGVQGNMRPPLCLIDSGRTVS